MNAEQGQSDDTQNSLIDKNLLKCRICRKTFTNVLTLKSHQLEHENITCNICYKVVSKSSLYHHMNLHIAEKKYKCPICAKGFTRKSSLAEHNKVHRIVSDTIFECDICSKRFVRKYSFDEHRKIHTGDKLLNCNICARKFTRKETLAAHKLTHSAEKRFKCGICLNEFRKIYDTKMHMLQHFDRTPHTCNECSKEFLTARLLKQHLKIHDKKFQCTICFKLFTRFSGLIKHKQKCKSKQMFKCNECTKQFITSHLLKQHSQIHNKKFQCLICSKLFTHLTGIVKHREKCQSVEPNENKSSTDNHHLATTNGDVTQPNGNVMKIPPLVKCNLNYNANGKPSIASTNFDQINLRIEPKNKLPSVAQQQINEKQYNPKLCKDLLEINPVYDSIYNNAQPNTITIKQELYDELVSDNIPLDLEQQNYELHSVLEVIKGEPLE